MLVTTEQSGTVKNLSGTTRAIRIIYLQRDVTVGKKPTIRPLPERPYKRCQWKLRPYTGSVLTVGTAGKGEVREGSYSRVSFGMQGGTMDLTIRYPLNKPLAHWDGNFVYNGTYTSYPPWSVDLLSQAQVKAMNKLRDKGGGSEFDLGLFWVERAETASLFRDAATGILKLAQAIARKDVGRIVRVLKDSFGTSTSVHAERRRLQRVERRLKRTLSKVSTSGDRIGKTFANTWLFHNLALSPLMRDLDSAFTRLQTGELINKTIIKSVGRVSKPGNFEKDTLVFKVNGAQVTQTQQGFATDEYQVILRASPKSDLLATMSRLGLINLPNLVYQGTPLSFVLDYWVAMGPYLQSLTTPLEFEWHSGSTGHRFTCRTLHEITSPGGLKMVGEGLFKSFERRVLTTFPTSIPPLSMRNRDLSDKQAITVGALAITRFADLIK